MDSITLSKQNRLYWLGRYTERVYTSLQYILSAYDDLDADTVDYLGICRKLGIPCRYTSSDDFWNRFLFDMENPDSLIKAVDEMLGNGMVLRETLSTPTLSYLQLAQHAMEYAAVSKSPYIELQWVIDDILAFRGSYDDTVESEYARNTIKAGRSVERISLMLRLDWGLQSLEKELAMLKSRLHRTDMKVNQASYEALGGDEAFGEVTDPGVILNSVETLFIV